MERKVYSSDKDYVDLNDLAQMIALATNPHVVFNAGCTEEEAELPPEIPEPERQALILTLKAEMQILMDSGLTWEKYL